MKKFTLILLIALLSFTNLFAENTVQDKNTSPEDIISFSLYGGVSFEAKPSIDLSIKIYCFPNMFILIQRGMIPASSTSLKISPSVMIPQSAVGLGGYIKPIKNYKMSLYGYGAIGLALMGLHGGHIKHDIYINTALYCLLRGCVGIDFPIVSDFVHLSIQNCFDYLIHLGFTNHINAGVTIKF